jgi:phage terminase small subunit
MNKTEKELNPKQAAFCREYIKDCNGKQAVIRAGYSAKNAEVKAAQLLRIVNVKKEISRLLGELLQEAKIPLEKRIFEYWMVRAFYDITEIVDLKGALKLTEDQLREKGLQVCIDSINRKLNAQGREIITYKFADKDAAVEMLQKYIRMIREEITITEDTHLIDLRNLLLERANKSPKEKERLIAELEKATGDPK